MVFKIWEKTILICSVIVTIFLLQFTSETKVLAEECSKEFIKSGVAIDSVLHCGTDGNSRPIFPSLNLNFYGCKWEDISHLFEKTVNDVDPKILNLFKRNKFSCAFIRKNELLLRPHHQNFCKQGFCAIYGVTGSEKKFIYLIDYIRGDIQYANNIKRNLCQLNTKFCNAGKSKFLSDYQGTGWMKGTGWHYYIDSFYTGLTPITVTPAALLERGKLIESKRKINQ